MPGWASRALLSTFLALSLIAGACGSPGAPSPVAHAGKGIVRIAGFSFSESSILASVYGGALQGEGYTVDYKLNQGSRMTVASALERGDVDVYPGYAASELEYYGDDPGLATPDAGQTTAELNARIASMNLRALDAAPASRTNSFAVLKSGRYGTAMKLSDLLGVAAGMTLGGSPECPRLPFCEPGLARAYGLHFKDFKALDSGGLLTKNALDRGDIDIGPLLSTDSSFSTGRYVQLEDDQHLQNADNVVPVGRGQVLTADVTSILNRVSARLTTSALIQMNERSDVAQEDPDQIAADWLRKNGFKI